MGYKMMIVNCRAADTACIGAFYDNVVQRLEEAVNYPHWIHGVYPSAESVRHMTAKGSQYMCVRKGTIVGAFALCSEPQGAYWKGNWSQEIADGPYVSTLHRIIRLQGSCLKSMASHMQEMQILSLG